MTEEGFTDDEKAAMKEAVKERKSARSGKANGLQDVLDKIAAMAPADRVLAERVHAIVTETAPELAPRTWYGMPAYAKGAKVLVFFQDAGKFKARYATLGFNDVAALDDGDMWPTTFAITAMTDEVEARIRELVRVAVG